MNFLDTLKKSVALASVAMIAVSSMLSPTMAGIMTIEAAGTESVDPSLAGATDAWHMYDSASQPAELTPQRNKMCWYPVQITVNSEGVDVWSTDAKFAHKDIELDGYQTGSIFVDYVGNTSNPYTPLTGITQREGNGGTISLGQEYTYINAHVGFNGTGAAYSGDLARFFMRTNKDTGNMYRYRAENPAEQGKVDDTNLQRLINPNLYEDIVSTLNDEQLKTLIEGGSIEFASYPCILDTDAPTITGYDSIGDRWRDTEAFNIYDYIGEVVYPFALSGGFNHSTIHYYRENAVTAADYGVTANYIAANPTFGTDMDNQMGLDSADNQVRSVSGSNWLGWNGDSGNAHPELLPFHTDLVPQTDITLNVSTTKAGYTGPGTGKIWDLPENTTIARGWGFDSILSGDMPDSDPTLMTYDNQELTVTVTAVDRPNQAGDVNTGTVTYTYTLTGFDREPPYLAAATYDYTGWDGTTDSTLTINAGEPYTATDIANWTQWTNQDVNLNLNGNEDFQIIAGTVTETPLAYLPMPTNPLQSDASSTTGKTFVFTGNIGSGSFRFLDTPYNMAFGHPQNTGLTYTTGGNNWTDEFTYDIFWIDQFIGVTTGTVDNVDTGTHGSPNVELTLTSTTGGHAGSILDDDIMIIGFSDGIGATPSPNTAAAAIAATTPTGTGGTAEPSNDTNFTQTKEIIFTNDWTGCIDVRDRAGNQEEVCVIINMATRPIELQAIPAFRPDDTYQSTGFVKFYQYDAGSFTGAFTTTGIVDFNDTAGTGEFLINIDIPTSSGYLITMKTEAHLSVGYTGNVPDANFYPNLTGLSFVLPTITNPAGTFDWFNNIDNGIDVNVGPPFTPGIPEPVVSAQLSLMVPGDINWNDLIGATDLAAVNAALTIDGTPAGVEDFNRDGFVTSQDQAILINGSNKNGFWRTYTNNLATSSTSPTAGIDFNDTFTSDFWLTEDSAL